MSEPTSNSPAESASPASGASADQPYVPASTTLPELTAKAIVLGVILSAVLAAANAYLGLKVGMTVSASIPAAVISMAILRLFRESNILENNIVQTAASAGESLAAGVIFTLPALILLGYWQDFEFLPTMSIALVGGILGVLFTIPLRRALIIEAKLKFPEGLATAEVLKAGNEGGGGMKVIAIGGAIGALFKLSASGFKAIAGSVHTSVTAGKSVFGMGTELAPALVAVGYIVGLNIAVLMLAGGVISWVFGIPLYMATAEDGELAKLLGSKEGYDAALTVWSKKIRFLGVGAMAVGGLWALVSLCKPIIAGVRSSIAAVRRAKAGELEDIPRTERDTPITIVFWGTLLLAIPIFIVFMYVVDQDKLGISSVLHITTVITGVVFSLIAGFLFSSVAGYMAGLVGSSNNPISGVTIATVLVISLLMLVLLGSSIDFTNDAPKALAAAATAILVGGVVCCAAAIAGDNMQDLKAGQLVGATPRKQQIMQIVGVAAAAIAIAPILSLLFNAYGLGEILPRPGMNPQEALTAPQAGLMASVSGGVLRGGLPWGLVAIGGVLAVIIIAIDSMLAARKSPFRMPVLAVAVGIYLPLELTVPIFIGGLIAHFANRALASKSAADKRSASRSGLLFASGLITGEALMGIALAIPFAAAQSTDVIAFSFLPESWGTIGKFLGMALLGITLVWLYRVATRVAGTDAPRLGRLGEDDASL